MISKDNLEFFFQNNMNVLLVGEHGIGKTSIVRSFWETKNIKAMYLNGSTLDPWVDLIGIPKEQRDEKGAYLEIVPPKSFRDDEVEAIFLDEINRSTKAVRNAVFELVQFRSINGRKFNNLRFVWAAMNPETEENTYDIEKLDPALKDRFPIHINLDFKCDTDYFTKKYGPDIARHSIAWWNGLPEKLKREVSPRRLDYALETYRKAGKELGPSVIRLVVPSDANVGKLLAHLTEGVPLDTLKRLYTKSDFEGINDFLQNVNNYDECKDWIFSNAEVTQKLIHCIHQERINEELSIGTGPAFDNILSCYHVSESVEKCCDTIIKANPNMKKAIFSKIPLLESEDIGKSPLMDVSIGSQPSNADFAAKIRSWHNFSVRQKIPHSEFYATIKEGLSDSLPNMVIKECREMLIYQMKFNYPNIVKSCKDNAFSALNYCLSRLNTDIRHSDYSEFINKMIKNKMEHLLWIPK